MEMVYFILKIIHVISLNLRWVVKAKSKYNKCKPLICIFLEVIRPVYHQQQIQLNYDLICPKK